MNDLILHHYPQSPVAEKVRTGLGLKELSWASVIIPRIPPKPDVIALTGGYRRTPVMQVGADIYCDSQCILRELERRFPEPTFFPNNDEAGFAWAFSRWTDTQLFDSCVRIVISAGADSLPEEFARDRGRLYFGPDCDLKKAQADIPHLSADLAAAFGWLEDVLSDGRAFLGGKKPGLRDALVHFLVWFLAGRWAEGPTFLARFPKLVEWETRAVAIGHGTAVDMESSAALEIAKNASPEPRDSMANDAQGIAAGQIVSVAPDVDGGEDPVTGQVHFVSKDEIALLHENPRVGTVAVHFPRVGYRVTPA